MQTFINRTPCLTHAQLQVPEVAPTSAGLVLSITNTCGTLAGIAGNMLTGVLAGTAWGFSGKFSQGGECREVLTTSHLIPTAVHLFPMSHRYICADCRTPSCQHVGVACWSAWRTAGFTQAAVAVFQHAGARCQDVPLSQPVDDWPMPVPAAALST